MYSTKKMYVHVYVCMFIMFICASAHVCTDVCMHAWMQKFYVKHHIKLQQNNVQTWNPRYIWFGLVLALGQNACDDGPTKKGALQCTAQDPPAGTSRQSETSKPQAACLKFGESANGFLFVQNKEKGLKKVLILLHFSLCTCFLSSNFLWHKMLWQGGTWHFLEASLQHCRRGHTAIVLKWGFTKTTHHFLAFLTTSMAKMKKISDMISIYIA